MIETIKKCDRCKCVADNLIDLDLVNKNVSIKEDEDDLQPTLTAMLRGRSYPRIDTELCYNCVEDLLRWLGHVENDLNVRMIPSVKN